VEGEGGREGEKGGVGKRGEKEFTNICHQAL
jgi:hypothetical protein